MKPPMLPDFKFITVTNVKTLPLLKLKQINVCVLRLDDIV